MSLLVHWGPRGGPLALLPTQLPREGREEPEPRAVDVRGPDDDSFDICGRLLRMPYRDAPRWPRRRGHTARPLELKERQEPAQAEQGQEAPGHDRPQWQP